MPSVVNVARLGDLTGALVGSSQSRLILGSRKLAEVLVEGAIDFAGKAFAGSGSEMARQPARRVVGAEGKAHQRTEAVGCNRTDEIEAGHAGLEMR